VDELRSIFEGLMANELLEYDYILTGYMGSGELLHVVAEYISLIKSKFPHVKYRKYFKLYFLLDYINVSVCDPVIGDNGKLVSNAIFL
jgi:pyridoxal/pyridoxine/pyridoxamine kinase